MKAPIVYFGGKGNMLSNLIELFPQDCNVYIEPYGGSGSVLLGKPRHQVEIYNDLESNVYTLFKVLAGPGLFVQFQRLCELALYCHELSNEYRNSLRSDELTQVQRAFQFWYVNRTRVNGTGGFSTKTQVRRNMSKSTSDFLGSVDGLGALHARLSMIVVTNYDAIDLICKHDAPGHFIYADPPYVQSTRSKTRYAQDATDEHHRELVFELLALQHAKVMLSGYDNPLYAPLIAAGWHRKSFTVNQVDGTNAPKQATESVWMNYQPQRTLL